MKRVVFILLLNFLFGGLFAEEPIYCELPIAGTDDFLAAKVNPAALSFGNASGLGVVGSINTNKKFVEDTYSLLFNSDNFAYVLDHAENDEHTIMLSSKVFRNIYLGSSYRWTNKYYKEGKWQESMLWRPFDFFSLGAAANDIFHDDRNYRFGLALRPLHFLGIDEHKIAFSTDFSYQDEEMLKPVLGLQTELLNGISLGGSYNMENKTIAANFSLNLGALKLGSLAGFDKDKEFAGGNSYLNFSDKHFRSFIRRNKKDRFYDYKLSGKIIEKKSSFELGPIRIVSGEGQTLSSVIKKLEKIKKDDKIGGIIFKSGNMLTSYANFVELKNALLDFKTSGKKIIFYFEDVGNMNYVLASSVADKIYLNPLGSVGLKGMSIKLPYVKDALNKLGIEVVNFRSHKYKTAGNIFSENAMTEEEKKSYESLLSSLYEEMIDMIESGRREHLTKSVKDLIDAGPYFIAQDALEEGLIDGLVYEDELEDRLKEIIPKTKIVKKLSPETIKYDWSDEKKDKIAVIYAVGNIHSGKGQPGKTIGSETTVEALEKARKDKSVKGIILRVDSGGGSALASDIIAREVALCGKGEDSKPVVVSMAGAAASGGYYIAANADKIVAQPNTITGSIGVVGIFPVMEKMYEKLYINWETVKKGAHADIGSPQRQMTPEEKEKAEKSIEFFYDIFTKVVAEGRNMEQEKVHEYAQGRVWTGKQALKRGLIDELGGMDVAVSVMKELTGIDNEIDLVEYEAGKEKLTVTLNMNTFGNFFQNHLTQQLTALFNLVEDFNRFGKENILMLSPIESDVTE